MNYLINYFKVLIKPIATVVKGNMKVTNLLSPIYLIVLH